MPTSVHYWVYIAYKTKRKKRRELDLKYPSTPAVRWMLFKRKASSTPAVTNRRAVIDPGPDPEAGSFRHKPRDKMDLNLFVF